MRKKFFIALNVSRPPLWIALPLVFSMGLAYGRRGLADPAFAWTPLMILQLFLLSFPFCLFTFGLNDIYDWKSDAINPRKTGMEGKVLSPEYHRWMKTTALYIGAVFLAVSLLTLNPANIFFSLAMLVLSYVYSSPPWRLKTRPPLDVGVAGIIGFLAPFALGYSFVDDAMKLPLQSYGFAVCVMGFHAFSTLMDLSVDRQVGDRTFGVAFGRHWAAGFPALICLAGIFFVHVVYVKIFFLLCTLLFLLAMRIPSERFARYSFFVLYGTAVVVLGVWVARVLLRF